MLIFVVKSNRVNHIFLVKLVAVDANLGISSLFKEVGFDSRCRKDDCIVQAIPQFLYARRDISTKLHMINLKTWYRVRRS